MRAQTCLLLALGAFSLGGCHFKAAGDPTASPSYWGGAEGSPTPYYGDDPADDDLTIVSVAPVDGARYLPSAFQIKAKFSEPYLGLDGEIYGRFGPTCGAGVILRPQLSEDRSEVTWNMSAAPGMAWCFDLTVYSNLEAPPHVQAEWETAACGVSFDAGQQAHFLSIAGESGVAQALNAAMEGYYYPMLLSLPGVAKDATFPLTTDVILSPMLQVLADVDGQQLPTGEWALDPVNGASGVMQDCQVTQDGKDEPWLLSCDASEVMLPINLQIGAMLTDGVVVKESQAALLRLDAPTLTATVSDSGAFATLTDFRLSGAISEADLLAMAEAAGGGSIEGDIGRLDKDADTNGDGTLDGYTLELASSPVWIPTLSCDPGLY